MRLRGRSDDHYLGRENMTADEDLHEGFNLSDPIHEWIERAAGTDEIACPICRNATWIVYTERPLAFVMVGTPGELQQSVAKEPLGEAADTSRGGEGAMGSMHLVYAV